MSMTININDKKYEIPERLTREQYAKAIQFDWHETKYYPMIMAQLTGAPINLLLKSKKQAMYLGMALLVKSMNQRTECEMLDLDKITFGQFVDLEVMISRDPRKTLDKMIAIMYQAKDTRDWQLRDTWPSLQKYLVFRKGVYNSYKALFEIDDLDSGTVDEVVDQGHAWYDMIMILADEKFLNIDSAVDRPLTEAFNFLAWKKDQALKMEQQIQKQKQHRR